MKCCCSFDNYFYSEAVVRSLLKQLASCERSLSSVFSVPGCCAALTLHTWTIIPTKPLHHILSIWPLPGPCLLSRCHQHLSMLCCAASSSYCTFLLKSTNWLLQPEWPNVGKLQSTRDSSADPLAQTCISVLSPAQVTPCNDTCEGSSSCSSAAQGDAEQSSPSLSMQEDLLFSSATKTQTPA